MKHEFAAAAAALCLAGVLAPSAASADALTEAQKEAFSQVLASRAKWNQLVQSQVKKTPLPAEFDSIGELCQIKVVVPEQNGELKTPDGKLILIQATIDIEGRDCPFRLKSETVGTQSETGFDARVHFDVQGLTDEFKKEMDVDEIQLTMEISGHMRKEGEGDSAPIATVVSVSMKGEGHSQKQGRFHETTGLGATFKLTPSPGGGIPGIYAKIEESLSFSFGGFAADLKSDVEILSLIGPIVDNYYLNGNAVEKPEYDRFRSHIQLPSDQDAGANLPPGQTALQCRIWVYRAEQVSLVELQRAIQTETPVTAPAILDQPSCSRSAAWEAVDGVNQLRATLQFKKEYVDFLLILNQGATATLSFLNDERSDLAEQLGSYVYRLKCDPVPACRR